jgi:hypothetical protein
MLEFRLQPAPLDVNRQPTRNHNGQTAQAKA